MYNQETLNKFYRYAVSLTASQDLAFDLVQDTLEKLLKANTNQTSNRYFYVVMRNLYIDQYRKQQKMPLVPIVDELSESEAMNLESQMISQDEFQGLLNLLDASERELLFLSAVEGYSARELAKLTEQPRGTVLSKLHRIKQRLKHKIKQQQRHEKGL